VALGDDSNELDTYCRSVEAYLCRKNDGHLIRIVGPAFDQVCGWAVQGIPLKVVNRGIDRYVDRYYAKGSRRRPVRIEFCEADVLDVFDEWKRAVGVARVAATGEGGADDGSRRRHESLAAHLERVVARATTLRAGAAPGLDAVLESIVREVDAARAGSTVLRGDARSALLERLRVLDARLLDAARAACDADALHRFEGDADRELAPFRLRMPEEAYAQSKRLCVDRFIREHFRLPSVTFD
jgi:hypothetical protein